MTELANETAVIEAFLNLFGLGNLDLQGFNITNLMELGNETNALTEFINQIQGTLGRKRRSPYLALFAKIYIYLFTRSTEMLETAVETHLLCEKYEELEAIYLNPVSTCGDIQTKTKDIYQRMTDGDILTLFQHVYHYRKLIFQIDINILLGTSNFADLIISLYKWNTLQQCIYDGQLLLNNAGKNI